MVAAGFGLGGGHGQAERGGEQQGVEEGLGRNGMGRVLREGVCHVCHARLGKWLT